MHEAYTGYGNEMEFKIILCRREIKGKNNKHKK